MKTIQSVASEMYNNLECKIRKDNSSFYCCINTIEWQTDIIREAHGERLPNDFIYNTIHTVLDIITNLNVDATESEVYDLVYTLEPDIVTYELTSWLQDNNIEYLTEALERGVTDGYAALSIAQLLHMQEIATSLISAIISYIKAN